MTQYRQLLATDELARVIATDKIERFKDLTKDFIPAQIASIQIRKITTACDMIYPIFSYACMPCSKSMGILHHLITTFEKDHKEEFTKNPTCKAHSEHVGRSSLFMLLHSDTHIDIIARLSRSLPLQTLLSPDSHPPLEAAIPKNCSPQDYAHIKGAKKNANLLITCIGARTLAIGLVKSQNSIESNALQRLLRHKLYERRLWKLVANFLHEPVAI